MAVATNAGKAIGILRSLSDVSEDGQLLWLALDALEAPLQLAICFQKRQSTMSFFHGPVQLTRCTIEACEQLLARDDGEDSRPSSEEGWLKWLAHTKKGFNRKDALPKLTARLSICMNSLQLAFVASAAINPSLGSMPTRGLRQPFEFLADALQAARDLVHEFEMGRRKRLLCCMGTFYTSSMSAVEGRESVVNWSERGAHTLWVELGDDDTYQLCSRVAPKIAGLDDDDEKEESAALGTYAADMKTTFKLGVGCKGMKVARKWSGELRTELGTGFEQPPAKDAIAYIFRNTASLGAPSCVIFFEVPSNTVMRKSPDDEEGSTQPISVETFDSFLTMLALKQGKEETGRALDQVCDLETNGGCTTFQNNLGQYIGKYQPAK